MNEMERCSEYCHMLSDFVDGDLSQEFCLLLEKHLQECENCRIVLNTMKKTIEIYQQTEVTTKIPEDVKERLLTSLSLEGYIKK